MSFLFGLAVGAVIGYVTRMFFTLKQIKGGFNKVKSEINEELK